MHNAHYMVNPKSVLTYSRFLLKLFPSWLVNNKETAASFKRMGAPFVCLLFSSLCPYLSIFLPFAASVSPSPLTVSPCLIFKECNLSTTLYKAFSHPVFCSDYHTISYFLVCVKSLPLPKNCIHCLHFYIFQPLFNLQKQRFLLITLLKLHPEEH